MKSYPKSTEHFVAEGGMAPSASTEKDPFQALDDLMVVIEALCPVWPQRKTFEKSCKFRL